MGGSYDWKYVRGSKFICSNGHKWGLNVTIKQAKKEKLNICGICGQKAKFSKATKNPI